MAHLFKYIIVLIPIFLCESLAGQNVSSGSLKKENIFQLKNPDYKVSPMTGMTKKHWRDAAIYLLDGAFSKINSLEDPLRFPKLDGKSYPNNPKQIPTEKLEGLCRTLFIAAPLMKNNSEIVINHIKLKDYYKHQILNLLDTTKPSYIPVKDPKSGPSQILVEFGALAISLYTAPEVLWETLTKEEQDLLAKTMLSYGEGPTIGSNWRFFNIFIMSFFKEKGYPVNDKLMKDYLNKTLAQYRGDGWYNDSPAYDYYSMWAFQLYGVLWTEFYGKKNEPEIAGQFVKNLSDMRHNYPYMFAEDGKMNMWGRSISYRFGAISPLPFLSLTGDKDINYGWMRRIASSSILQFLQSPDFLQDNVPTLGFYGHFEPAVQIYSCRGSSYWMGKAFLGLLVPDDNPFWTEKENNGPWENSFQKTEVYNKFQQNSNLLITNYPSIGASEVRSWCHEKEADDWQKFRSTENYNRLSYNTAFPWQADGENGEVSMNYVIKNSKKQWEPFRLYTFKKFENNIYYRDVVLETDESVKMKLAEMPLPNGILRVDNLDTSKPLELKLGHYALPRLDRDIKISEMKIGNSTAKIIDNGQYQLAILPIAGWQKVDAVEASNLNPVSEKSTVLMVSSNYKPGDKSIFSVLMLWKKSGEKWRKKDFEKVTDLKSTDNNTVQFLLNGKSNTINFIN